MMEKKMLVGITIIGVTQILICLFFGAPSFVSGLSWFLADVIVIVTGGGGNLTGLGLIIGLLIAIIGGVFLFGFLQAILLLKLNPKGRTSTIIFMSFAGVLLAKVDLFEPTGIFHLGQILKLGITQKLGIIYFVTIFNVISIFYLIRPQISRQFIENKTLGAVFRSEKPFFIFIMILVAISLYMAIVHNTS